MKTVSLNGSASDLVINELANKIYATDCNSVFIIDGYIINKHDVTSTNLSNICDLDSDQNKDIIYTLTPGYNSSQLLALNSTGFVVSNTTIFAGWPMNFDYDPLTTSLYLSEMFGDLITGYSQFHSPTVNVTVGDLPGDLVINPIMD